MCIELQNGQQGFMPTLTEVSVLVILSKGVDILHYITVNFKYLTFMLMFLALFTFMLIYILQSVF